MNGAAGAGAEPRRIALTNAGKVLYPATGFTKRDLVEWYEAVADAILPHLAGHPVTLARYPDGVDAPGWYQTNCPPGRPPWLPVAEVRGAAGQTLRYCLVEDVEALRWVANTGALELHPLLLSIERPGLADTLVLTSIPPSRPHSASAQAWHSGSDRARGRRAPRAREDGDPLAAALGGGGRLPGR